MNFDDDFERFQEFIRINPGESKIELSKMDLAVIGLFVSYLNIIYLDIETLKHKTEEK